MKTEQIIAATLLIGNKVFAYHETVATEVWSRMDFVQREGTKVRIRNKLASIIAADDLAAQVQTYVTEAPLESVTYHLAGPIEGAVASEGN